MKPDDSRCSPLLMDTAAARAASGVGWVDCSDGLLPEVTDALAK